LTNNDDLRKIAVIGRIARIGSFSNPALSGSGHNNEFQLYDRKIAIIGRIARIGSFSNPALPGSGQVDKK
jgi:hypothetical protein